MKYFRETGKTTYTVTNAVGNILQETLANLDVMSADEVQDLYDKLSRRVFDLESANAATAHFHMVKGAEGPGGLDAEYKHVSPAMPKHTARRETRAASPPLEGDVNELTPSKFYSAGSPVKYKPDEFFESPFKSGPKFSMYPELQGRESLPSYEDMTGDLEFK